MSSLPGFLSPQGMLLWFGWNVAVLSSVQLTVRLIRAYSLSTTLFGAACMTAASVPITLLYALVLNAAFAWYPFAMALTAAAGFAVAHYVLGLKRVRARLVAAFGTALLSGPWPVFLSGVGS
jgi:hypothetical protein